MASEHFSLAQEQHWGGNHLLHPCLISAQTYTKWLRNRSLVAGGGGLSLVQLKNHLPQVAVLSPPPHSQPSIAKTKSNL